MNTIARLPLLKLLAGVLLSAAIVLLGRSFWKRREGERSPQNLQSEQAGKMGRATQLILAVAALLSVGAPAKNAFAGNTRFDGQSESGAAFRNGGRGRPGGTTADQGADQGVSPLISVGQEES